MIRALPWVLDTEDHPRRQRSHHVIHYPSEISQQYCSMCCISTNNAFTVRVSSCPLSLPRIYCSSNDIFSVPKLNFHFLDKRPHIFRVLGISRFTRFLTPARPADFTFAPPCGFIPLPALPSPAEKRPPRTSLMHS